MIAGNGHLSCAFALASTLLLSACEVGQPTSSAPPVIMQPGGTGTVALLVPYGSDDSNNAALARSLENGARLAISEIADSGITLKVFPTGGTPAGAVAAAEHALENGVSAILGPVFGNAALAVGPIAARHGTPVFSFSNRIEIAGGNVYLLGHTHSNSAHRVLQYAQQQGRNKVLVVHADNNAGHASRMAVERATEALGMEFSGALPHEFTQIGVINSVPEIVAATRETGADLLVLTGNTAGALPLFAQMIPEAGVDPEEVQIAGLTRWDIPPSNLRINGLQGGWFPLPDPNLAASFRYRYQYAYDEPPHSLAGLSYDGIVVLQYLLKSDGRLDQGSIAAPGGFSGADGIFRFLPDGTVERGLAVAEVKDFRKVVISPSPRTFLDGES